MTDDISRKLIEFAKPFNTTPFEVGYVCMKDMFGRAGGKQRKIVGQRERESEKEREKERERNIEREKNGQREREREEVNEGKRSREKEKYI